MCLKRLVNTHTCVFAETHADTALSAHSLLRARATHRHAPVLLARSLADAHPAKEGRRASSCVKRRDVASETKETPNDKRKSRQ